MTPSIPTPTSAAAASVTASTVEFADVSVTAVVFWLLCNEVLDVTRSAVKAVAQSGVCHDGIDTSVNWDDFDAS